MRRRTHHLHTRDRHRERRLGRRVQLETLDWYPRTKLRWTVPPEERRRWALARRRRAWMRRQLREVLPLRERLAIELVWLNRMKQCECADLLRVHPSTVQRAMERGIRRMQRNALRVRALWPGEDDTDADDGNPK